MAGMEFDWGGVHAEDDCIWVWMRDDWDGVLSRDDVQAEDDVFGSEWGTIGMEFEQMMIGKQRMTVFGFEQGMTRMEFESCSRGW